MELQCCIHVAKDNSHKVQSFSLTSWEKIKQCVSKWILTDSEEKQKAELLINIIDVADPPPNIGYHRKCYIKFTDKTRIAAYIRKSQVKNNSKIVIKISELSDKNIECEFAVKHFLRSNESARASTSNTETNQPKHILPRVCIICRSKKFILNKLSKKRKQEKLVQCETHSNQLLKAAIEKKDEAILIHIRDKDLVSIEMCYHSSCYKHYTRFLSKRDAKICCDSSEYENSFKKFCSTIVEKRIIEGKEILRISKLRDLFLKFVQNVDHVKITTYRNGNLKRRLQIAYPQLCFVKQSQRNICELVFCETIDRDTCQTLNAEYLTSTDSETEELCQQFSPEPNNLLQVLYSSALVLKTSIANAPLLPCSWPPTGCDLTLETAASMVPTELFNFLAWLMGASDEPQLNKYVKVPDNIKRKLLSIAQDILYLASSGKKQTPKHLALGMTVRHITGSAKLISLLNGLGHSVSHSAVLQHDTDLAIQQINTKSLTPPGFKKNVFTTLVWDNNDFGEETLTGEGTTHTTNGIILQWKSEVTQANVPSPVTGKKGRKRSIDPPPKLIVHYKDVKKVGPNNMNAIDDSKICHLLSYQEYFRKVDAAFYLSKLSDVAERELPGWTGFNTQLSSTEIIPITKIGYLPVLDANPTDMATVNTILVKSLEIADTLQLPHIVLVMDQALYSKAQQIRWHNKEFQKRIVLRLGDFHTVMSFLAILGKRFQDAGLQDIFIESGLVAENSITGVLNGHHYNRSIRAHKIMAEALQYLRWGAFIEQVEDTEINLVTTLRKELNNSFRNKQFFVTLAKEETNRVLDMYTKFIIRRSIESPTFAFWSSYLEMVELMLLFLRATREGNWFLHLSAITSMMPWYFAYDRVNYARYLPVYWMEMVNLQETHPSVHIKFVDGHFVVQRQQVYGFAQTACDQVIEQTFNRESKTRGGLTGFTLNKGAVHRWVLSHHSRASILAQCEVMAGKESVTRNRKELDTSRIRIDTLAVKKVSETMSSLIDPFFEQHEQLLNIVSGTIIPDEVQKDIMEACDRGKQELTKFVTSRLVDGTCNLFAPLKFLKLKTFSFTGKLTQTKVKSENLALKASRQLLTRLLLVAKVQNLNVQNLMEYSLSPVPPAISNYDGTIAKTNKATLIHFLESYPDVKLPSLEAIPAGSALLIDGMAMLQQMKQIPLTFGELATKILRQLVRLAKELKCTRIDFVTDRYPDVSIKDNEWHRRSSAGTQLIKIVSDNQLVPKQWRKYLSVGKNKEALISYFYASWIKYEVENFEDIMVFITHKNKCHALNSPIGNTLNICDVEGLFCDHEEADTRLLLHAAHASQTHKSVVIKCNDTDVLMVAVSLGHKISAELFVLKGTVQNQTVINISEVCKNLGRQLCEAMIGLHVFTGCDSVSSFKGKGKLSAIKLIMASDEFTAAFIHLGALWTIDEKFMNILETFVCHLYGQSHCTSINTCRYNWLHIGCHSDIGLPPNKDCLQKHMMRANYQAAIHRRSLAKNINAPPPTDHGWKIENGILTIDWMIQQPVPSILMEYIHCKCKKNKCSKGQCSCQSSKIPCSELCMCIECENKEQTDDVFDVDEEN